MSDPVNTPAAAPAAMPSAPTTLNEAQPLMPAPQRPATISVGTRGVVLDTLDGIWRFAGMVIRSNLAPKGLQTQEAVTIAVQMGLEVGLTPMAALQNTAVINGRPTIWGDAQLAIVRGSGEVEEFDEWYEAGGKRLARNPSEFKDDTAAVCRVKRRGFAAVESAFTVGDAKRANLWTKEGPWQQYPARMLRFRARSFALRDTFGDALRGIKSTEDAMDEPLERDVTPASQGDAAPMLSAPEPAAPVRGIPSMPAGEPTVSTPTKVVHVPPVIPAAKVKIVEHTSAATEPTPATVPPTDEVPLGNQVREQMESDEITLPEIVAFCRDVGLVPPKRGTYVSVFDLDDKTLAAILAQWNHVIDHAREARAA